MTVGRAAAAALYLAAALIWVGAMLVGSALGCEGGCFGDEESRLDTSLVLSLVGLALAAAAFTGSLFSRRLGVTLLVLHAVLFFANLGVLSSLRDTDSPWILLVPGAIAAAAGYVAVGGHQLRRRTRQPS
jgi:hypothetical protein